MTPAEAKDRGATPMRGEREIAGRALYKERRTLLEGLWMPDAPPRDEPPEETKERRRQYTDKTTT